MITKAGKLCVLSLLVLLSGCLDFETEVTKAALVKIQRCFDRGLQAKVFTNTSAYRNRDEPRLDEDNTTVVCFKKDEVQQ